MPRICLLVLLSVALLGASGCGESLTDAQVLQRASQSVDAGDYRDAEVRLKSLLQEQGDNAQAWALLGRVSLARYRYADAVEQYGRARANGAGPDTVGVPLARALLAQGEYGKAIETLDTITPTDDSQRANVAALTGRAQLGLDQVRKAGLAFDAALDAVPDFAPALVGQAEIARGAEDIAGAQALLDRAMRAAPDYGPAWQAAGRLAYADNNCDQAAPAFDKFLSIDNAGSPAMLFQARSYLADCQLRVGEIDKARDNIRVLMKQGPDSAFANYLQALINLRDRDYEAAARHLQQVLAVSPNNVRSLTLMASIKLTQEDTGAAELFLNRAIARAPANVPALRLLTSLYLQRGDNERAIRMLEATYAKNPDSDGIRALLAQAMANSGDDETARLADDGALRLDVAAAMARSGNTAAAVAMLDGFSPDDADEKRRAAAIRIGVELRNQHPDAAIAAAKTLVAEAPDDPDALAILAHAYKQTGDSGQAGRTLDRALKIEPDNAVFLFARASAYASQRNYAKATQTLERLLALAPGDLRAQLAMVQVAAAQGDQAGALSWLDKARTSHPDNAQLAVKLVQAYLAAQNNAKALELADALVAEAPDNALFKRVRGVVLLADGRNDDAINSFKKAAALAPEKPAYRLDLAQAQISAQRPDDALEQLLRLRREQPQFLPAVSVLVRLQARTGNTQDALKTIEDIPVDNENRAAINTLKGQIWAAQDDYEEAAAAYASAYQAQPSRAMALALFDARRQAGMDDPTASLVDWLERRSDDTAVTLQLAQWYQANDRIQDAQRSYQALLATSEDNAVALNNLALIRSGLGGVDALDYARRAHRAAPDNAAIADTLGWLLVEDGQAAQGVVLLEQAAAELPEDATVQYHLAAGLVKTGESTQKARAQTILGRILQADTAFGDRDAARALQQRLAQDKAGT